MAASSSPLTFDLPLSLIERIEELKTKLGAASVSEVVRLAITRYDFSRFTPLREPHRQISVRLAPKQKELIGRLARKKGSSAGELLRVAIENLPARPNQAGVGSQTNQGKAMSKKTPKKSVKKAAKKAAKKPAKKAKK